MTRAEFLAQAGIVQAESTWWSARVVEDDGARRVQFGAGNVGTFNIGPAGARAFAASVLAAADEADGKTTKNAHSAVDDAVYQLTEKQRLGLGKSEVRNILTDLWPAIEAAFRVQALSEKSPAEAERDTDRALVRALVEALPRCECNKPSTVGQDGDLTLIRDDPPPHGRCDDHADINPPRGYGPPDADLPYAGPLRALLARMTTWPSAPAEPKKDDPT